MKYLCYLLFIGGICWVRISAQITLMLDVLPPGDTAQDTFYVAGSFNGWKADDPAFRFMETRAHKWELNFIPPLGKNEYKITRGSWESCEVKSNGADMANRSFEYRGGEQFISIHIEAWDDLTDDPAVPSSRSENVQIIDENFPLPQLSRSRRVWLYLPPDYLLTNEYYPVVYMMDGQNLFDATTSYAGEWMVDETLDSLYKTTHQGYIIVGIDNGSDKRRDEYSPWINQDYGGGEGDAFADFIVETLKPYIDANYRTLQDPKHTLIMGSSLGAYISLYTAMKYPYYFGNIGLFSPAFWFSNKIYGYTQENLVSFYGKIYFITGQREGQQYVDGMQAMYDLFAIGYLPPSLLHYEVAPDGEHKEWFWAREFPKALEWFELGKE